MKKDEMNGQVARMEGMRNAYKFFYRRTSMEKITQKA